MGESTSLECLHIPIEITKTKRQKGVSYYFVIFSDTKDGKGQWMKDIELSYPELIEKFNENEKNKKKNTRKATTATPRRIQKIAGANYKDSDLYFLVKFTDSDTFEEVPHADMKSRYTKSYLAFLEQHIRIIPKS